MVTSLAAGAPLTPVWRNTAGGLTFAFHSPGGRRFLKWAPIDSGLDLAAEETRLRWLAGRSPVPRVVSSGTSATGSWLVTEALPGDNAVSPRWQSDPRPAVSAIGHGLRALHDALPVSDCPFSWGVGERVARAVDQGRHNPAEWHREHRQLSLVQALARLEAPPPIDRLVVCHGDACAPNTLLEESGTWIGHVDLGSLGVADRWADLAVATWSLEWNWGPGWGPTLLDAYGITDDPLRTAYYRLLWDLG